MGQPELKYYTVYQLRNWLMHNIVSYGLSEKIIAKQRAWAIVNNPYVRDDDAIVSAIFVDGNVGAYTACFPEVLTNMGSRIWWLSTLYCDPKFLGQGFGVVVCGQLCELHSPEQVLDIDGAKETVEICRMLGLSDTYFDCWCFRNKAYTKNLLGYLAHLRDSIMRVVQKNKFNKETLRQDYSLQYISFIDDETYSFMKSCNRGTLRSQAMLNWILQFPFMQESPVIEKVDSNLLFTSTITTYRYWCVQVRQNSQLVSVYLLRNNPNTLSLKYLYLKDEKQIDGVVCSIIEHILLLKPTYFETTNAMVGDYINKMKIFEIREKQKKSYSYLPGQLCLDPQNIQAGDGDMFV